MVYAGAVVHDGGVHVLSVPADESMDPMTGIVVDGSAACPGITIPPECLVEYVRDLSFPAMFAPRQRLRGDRTHVAQPRRQP